MSLSDSSFKIRNSSLSQFEAQSAAEFAALKARLDAERLEGQNQHARETADARETVEATALEIEEEIATGVRAKLAKLAVDFADKPRSVAAEITKVWREADARCVEELGAGISYRHLAEAFSAAHGLATRASCRSFWTFNGSNAAAEESAKAAALMIGPNAAPVVVENALRSLEVQLATHAPKYPRDEDRSAATLSRATENAIRVACTAIDERREAEHRAASIASASASKNEKDAKYREENERARGSWAANAVPAKPKPSDEIFS